MLAYAGGIICGGDGVSLAYIHTYMHTYMHAHTQDGIICGGDGVSLATVRGALAFFQRQGAISRM